MFTYLKSKPTRPVIEATDIELVLQFQRKANNPGGKPTCVSILRKPRDIKIHKKLSKKNIAKTINKTSIVQKFLINRQNKRDHNKPKSSALAASNEDEKLQTLKGKTSKKKFEVAFLLKKDQIIPPQHVILVRRQILSPPLSKPST